MAERRPTIAELYRDAQVGDHRLIKQSLLSDDPVAQEEAAEVAYIFKLPLLDEYKWILQSAASKQVKIYVIDAVAEQRLGELIGTYQDVWDTLSLPVLQVKVVRTLRRTRVGQAYRLLDWLRERKNLSGEVKLALEHHPQESRSPQKPTSRDSGLS